MRWKKYTIETTTAAEDFISAMLMELGIEGVEIEDNIPLSKEDQADMFIEWKKYTIETTTAAEDFISAMLMELGIEGVEIEDNIPLSKEDQADMFIDFLPELPPDDGVSHVSFYLPLSKEDQADMFIDFLPELPPDDGVSHVSFYLEDHGEDFTELLKQVKTALEELRRTVEVGSGIITSDVTEDLDWINNWKQFFSSFYIDDILIKPTWEELKPEDADKFLIEIDPGVSFGTGKHETTQLCIRQLLKYIRGTKEYTPEWTAPRVLDVGCGSGILSIVALKLGASAVVGTDLDADCMTSTRENMEVNHLDTALGTFYVGNLIDDAALQQKVSAVVGTDLDADCMTSTRENMEVNHLDTALGTFYVGNLIDDAALQQKVGSEKYEIVVANILADVIIPMTPVIPALLKEGGYFITSGIIDFKENEVKQAIEQAGLTVVEINHQGEWVVNITARK